MSNPIVGGIEYNEWYKPRNLTGNKLGNIGNALNNSLKSVLFLEALRNLNWSRGYNWYVELDGVPNPFQRGGVLGLPVTNVTLTVANGTTYDWDAGLEKLSVPLRKENTYEIDLTMYDDEQGTIVTFFERWFNMIYNSYNGVLPLNEACKCITITKTKSTRATAYRHIQDIKGEASKVPGRSFLVYPYGTLEEAEKIESGPRTYTVRLKVANVLDADYGSPTEKLGQKSIFGIDIGEISTEEGFLSKVADYI